ncbi:hypothetical protein Lpar_3029 [Legionella parisiensis]|uniref:Uncharacterized protein n=1 Tax=Legionella parisiensis TaxID=45071 RepID=A0A1E5JMH2_9GAMM|nr:hypothetical protein Lpar_3029 [Legionella parisiensis]OEH45729.1 hypothetical protein lpari_03242 [Legionella parisiensis]STX75966.1 Uncharacterised protein [Legionella parisiensis]
MRAGGDLGECNHIRFSRIFKKSPFLSVRKLNFKSTPLQHYTQIVGINNVTLSNFSDILVFLRDKVTWLPRLLFIVVILRDF